MPTLTPFDRSLVTVKKNITLPLLKLKDDGSPVFVSIDIAIFKAKDINKAVAAEAAEGSAPAAAKQAPELTHVTNLETGDKMQMIVNAVLGTELREAYPENAYVGKMFQIQKFKQQGGKRYATFQIAEIEIKQTEAPATENKPAAAQQSQTPAKAVHQTGKR